MFTIEREITLNNNTSRRNLCTRVTYAGQKRLLESFYIAVSVFSLVSPAGVSMSYMTQL